MSPELLDDRLGSNGEAACEYEDCTLGEDVQEQLDTTAGIS